MKRSFSLAGSIVFTLLLTTHPLSGATPTEHMQQEAQQFQLARQAAQIQLRTGEQEDFVFVPLWKEGITVAVDRKQLEAAIHVWLAGPDATPEAKTEVETFIQQYSKRYRDELTEKVRELAIDADLMKLELERIASKGAFQTKNSLNLAQKEKPSKAIAMRDEIKGPLPWASTKKKQAGQEADLSIDIEDVSVDSRLGYRRWDFTRVFKENNGVGVTLTDYEMSLDTPLNEARQEREGQINVRIEPYTEVRRKGYMWLEGGPPKYSEKHLTARMTMVFRGKDDNGHSVEVKSVFRR